MYIVKKEDFIADPVSGTFDTRDMKLRRLLELLSYYADQTHDAEFKVYFRSLVDRLIDAVVAGKDIEAEFELIMEECKNKLEAKFGRQPNAVSDHI